MSKNLTIVEKKFDINLIKNTKSFYKISDGCLNVSKI